ncbi:MAG: YggU family protein [Dehalococcoidia bacterium]|nr:MAG: YggU family protein [Dehalococcoidia bacterium]
MLVPKKKVSINVRIQPNADRNAILSYINGILRISITASPVKGKANKMLLAFLSQILKTSKDNVRIISGHNKRNKHILVHGLNQEEIVKLVEPKNYNPL